ncbi:MAG: hypothetical protein KME15_01850 [Drouetiella hepatica Uher 2000/2452]|uniref:Uncharacterized protein n=1 Tax=Drouetiella hepatica Uher 2000/2452 TaxID=904376 RepID=A0A951Q7P5_9CYAN|nr:hypothetical protein [Drouetiella hepatica Uher 2000/2452]
MINQVKAWFEATQSTGFEGNESSDDWRVEAEHHRQDNQQIWVVLLGAISELYQPTLVVLT